MQKTLIIIILATFTLSFFNCKKYPDDKGINTKRPVNRIFGEWILKRILLNGNDITQQMNDSISNRDFEGIVLEVLGDYFQRDTPRDYYQTQLVIDAITRTRFSAVRMFEFEKNEDFKVGTGSYTPSSNNYSNMQEDLIFTRHFNGKFKILRLQKHNFNLQSKSTNIVYEFIK